MTRHSSEPCLSDATGSQLILQDRMRAIASDFQRALTVGSHRRLEPLLLLPLAAFFTAAELRRRPAWNLLLAFRLEIERVVVLDCGQRKLSGAYTPPPVVDQKMLLRGDVNGLKCR